MWVTTDEDDLGDDKYIDVGDDVWDPCKRNFECLAYIDVGDIDESVVNGQRISPTKMSPIKRCHQHQCIFFGISCWVKK